MAARLKGIAPARVSEDWDKLFVTNAYNPQAPFNGRMFETYGREKKHVLDWAEKHPLRVFTVCNGEDADGNEAFCVWAGLHSVNRIGYVLSAKDLIIREDYADLKFD